MDRQNGDLKAKNIFSAFFFCHPQIFHPNVFVLISQTS
jgi:hypothetical protein